MADKSILGFLICALLLGCGPASTPVPTVTPVPQVTVGVSAAPLALAAAELYLEEEGPLPFDLVPAASEAGLAAEKEDHLFHLDYPPVPEDRNAFPVGWEGVAVIVNRQVTVRAFSFAELEEIFTGRVLNWSELGGEEQEIQVIVPPPGDRLRSYFEENISPEARITTGARLAGSPADAVNLVATEEGAIGLMPLHQGTGERVALTRVAGVLPAPSTVADGSYPLRLPLLALTPGKPTAVVYEWLLWAQAKEGDFSPASASTFGAPSTPSASSDGS